MPWTVEGDLWGHDYRILEEGREVVGLFPFSLPITRIRICPECAILFRSLVRPAERIGTLLPNRLLWPGKNRTARRFREKIAKPPGCFCRRFPAAGAGRRIPGRRFLRIPDRKQMEL